MTSPSELDLLGRILLAAGLAALVGAERELADHPAGLRTHISVAVGSALFAIVSAYGFLEFDQPRNNTNIGADVTRVASNIVTGVGFLGGGAILKEGATVRGLTTAASLWVTAAIGLAAGLGSFGAALGAAGILLATLTVMRLPERWISRVSSDQEAVIITLKEAREAGPVVEDLVTRTHVRSLHIAVRDGRRIIEADVKVDRGKRVKSELAPLVERDDVAELAVG